MRVTSPPMTELQKRHMRRVKGIKAPFSRDIVKPVQAPKERDYYAPVKANFVPTVRGRTGCKLSASKRAMVQSRLGQRKAFFAELGVQV